MTYSLRRVLAVRFSLTMLVALTFIALWALLAFQRVLRQQMDTALAGVTERTSAIIASGQRLTFVDQPRDFDAFTERVNRFVVFRDAAGSIVQFNTSLAAGLPLDSGALAGARRGEATFATQRWRGGWIRSAYLAAPQTRGSDTFVVQVAASLRPVDAANRHLAFVMFGTVLLGTLATAFGASWLARSAVQPVIEVAQQAKTLPPGIEGRRITAHANVVEYQSLIEVLNDLLTRSEGALTSQRRFIGDMGHELRTPLTALQGQIEVALRSERSPRAYQLVLEGALEEIQHLTRMADSLMLITQAESRAVVPQASPTDLSAVTRQVLDTQRRRIEEKDLDVAVTLEYTGPAPSLDTRLCTRAIQELVDNAVKFSPIGGRIVIGTRNAPLGEEWWIQDSGPGIDDADLPHLFEPFYRVDPARSRDGGSGLGLTLAASIARLHGGAIHVERLTAGGARFAITFPASTASAGSAAA